MWREIERTYTDPSDNNPKERFVRELGAGDIVSGESGKDLSYTIIIVDDDHARVSAYQFLLWINGGDKDAHGHGESMLASSVDRIVEKHEIEISLRPQKFYTVVEWYPDSKEAAGANPISPVVSRDERLTRDEEAAAAHQPKYPVLPPMLQVHPSIPEGLDPHPREYYTGDQGSNYPVLPPMLQTRPEPGSIEIHPPGYHTGGPGPQMPAHLRVPKGPFGG